MSLETLEKLTDNLISAEQEDRVWIRALEHFLSTSVEGFWIWNIKTNYLYCNWTWFDQLGYQGTEFPRDVSTWVNLCHPDDYQKASEALQAHFSSRGRARYDLPIRYRSEGGQWVSMRSYGEVIVWDEDDPIIMAGKVDPG